jgi:hypothetical protein
VLCCFRKLSFAKEKGKQERVVAVRWQRVGEKKNEGGAS